jgi:restriction system protein
MNIVSILISTITTYWWVIPIALAMLFFNSPSGKGVIGEYIINLSAKLMLDGSVYHLIKNVTLPTEDGSTQIDHIIVSKFGIFVMETKNYAGWIFGDEAQKMWTQKLHRQSHQFQNPLRQNYKHLRTLEEMLNIGRDKLFSVIVFVGKSKFKTSMPENVVQSGHYLRYIKSKKTPILSEDEVKNIVQQITSGRLKPSWKVNRQHVQHVKVIVSTKEAIIANNQATANSQESSIRPCPKCGRKLVHRISRSGDRVGSYFWGCSGYPACRFIANID